jgi:CubicO group peptidase (beta-lactamase class C family)
VVDLWGGLADPMAGRPWTQDTLQLVYSATKAAAATCAHLLAQRGDLDLDRPVACYWPEFSAGGKADIPVRWLLSHRAGLPVIDSPIPLAALLAWGPMTTALAAQRPVWEPGTAHGYHGRTFGWLVGEVIRRVSGRSVGTFFAEEIAGPAGLDFFIGLPATQRARVSRMIIDDPPGAGSAALPLDQIPERFRGLVAAFTDPGSLMNRAFALSVPDIDFNDPRAQAAEIPSSNGICTADGLARLYAGLIGEVDGVRILDAATTAAAAADQASGIDRVLLVPSRFASGFMLPTEEAPLGGPSSFGHPGRGGSLGFADPESGVAFGYVVNHIRQDLNDTRAAALVNAVQACASDLRLRRGAAPPASARPGCLVMRGRLLVR